MKEFKAFGGKDRLLDDNNKSDDYKVYLTEKLNTLLNETLKKVGVSKTTD